MTPTYESKAIPLQARVIVRPEGLIQSKTPMALSGINPATFRFVAQRLNQVRRLLQDVRAECTVSEV